MNAKIYPPEELIDASIELPLSKSISNRALIMQALTPGAPELGGVAECDDTAALRRGLACLGGCVDVGPAGTAMRFLTAYYAATPCDWVVIDGNERMRQRPIGPLVDALRACGAEIEYAGAEGFPPLRIKGRRLHGGRVEMDATVSSQFVSALVMVAPTFSSPLELALNGEIASLPYLKMTLEMMRKRGIKAELDRNTVTVEPGTYLLRSDFEIERDWSAASYWYEICALTSGWITLPGLSLDSLQGDRRLAEIFEKLGVVTEEEESGISLSASPEVFSRLEGDLADNPDIAQTLAVTCCFLGVPFRLSGLDSLRIKETDRLAALQAELGKLSYAIEIDRGTLVWEGQRRPVQEVGPVETYGDHRMAMAFAPVGYFVPGLEIKDAEVVTKSYPQYWHNLRQAGFAVEMV